MCNIINNKKNDEMLVLVMENADKFRKRFKAIQDELSELYGSEFFEGLLSCEGQSETNLEKFLDDNSGEMINSIIKQRILKEKQRILIEKQRILNAKLENYIVEYQIIITQLKGLIS
jgi:hypothetical protein